MFNQRQQTTNGQNDNDADTTTTTIADDDTIDMLKSQTTVVDYKQMFNEAVRVYSIR